MFRSWLCLLSLHFLSLNPVNGLTVLRFRMIDGSVPQHVDCRGIQDCLTFVLFVKDADYYSVSFTTNATTRTSKGKTRIIFKNDPASLAFYVQTWKGVVHLNIYVKMGRKRITPHGPLFNQTLTLSLADGEKQFQIVSTKIPSWKFRVAFDASCYRDFFGPNCIKFCRPEDSRQGHYTCTPNGDKRCLPNWLGEASNCTKAAPCRGGRYSVETHTKGILTIVTITLLLMIAVAVVYLVQTCAKLRAVYYYKSRRPVFQSRDDAGLVERNDSTRPHLLFGRETDADL